MWFQELCSTVNKTWLHQVSRTVEHACDNIEDFITKRSSAGAVGAGTKSTEKKEVEKKEKYVTIKKKKGLPAPLAPVQTYKRGKKT